ncbi:MULTISPECIES: phosphotransferase family protein [Geobacillus]|uniref:Phosphotransferase n=1 Tax=Geobacillus thermocatenulatus TaxID=33938 RepID=A0A226QBB2_9BACL|nr:MULTISPECIES: phosphotransferase family protein [Geobacillus]KPC99718.1 Phosphotransferase enzyme family protein [Geobacillus sp. BCO2]RAN22500.1 phosphotransferase [Geobacillus sp. A8]ASS98498.1 phosphotransferase [Geobacillus thermocatenulatus]KLR74113.1 phosphotransferase [Geobacillus sp. T6]OXB89254.1 phosphotransferase [Geobacillus thermocatenulatus]
MEQLLGKEWEITPAGGATGDAYFAEYEGKKLFLKRNSSPFLAVLSAEGIVPKLVWTKRLENGDVFTAQQWLNGRELKPWEMGSEQVAALLRKIHRSKELVTMLKRLGKSPLRAKKMLALLAEQQRRHPVGVLAVGQALDWLEQHVSSLPDGEYVVCHCDINHNNWLLADDGTLYLIDWDGAMIADPAIDIGMLLHLYIPRAEWKAWLDQYGWAWSEELALRLKWYTIAHTLHSLFWPKGKDGQKEKEQSLRLLERVITEH